MIAFLIALLPLGLAYPRARVQPPKTDSTSVALARYEIIDAPHGDTIRAAIWYPTHDIERDTTLALQALHVAANGRYLARSSPRPLIVISHGTGGDQYGHWDSAETLARAGFIAVSIRHAGDNGGDQSALGTDRYLYGRATQITALLDHLLADTVWRGRIDSTRIGFLGYSAGGFTGLELLGGRPNVALLGAYCTRYPDDPLYCASGLRGRFQLRGRYDDRRADRRIRSAVLWAPAFSFLFDPAGLADIRAPIAIARAAQDSLVKEPDNVAHLQSTLARAPTVDSVPGAGHFIFLAPCGPALARLIRLICVDQPGVSRQAVHVELNGKLVRFFSATLGGAD
jgi:predicted dienelactone hydrolase